MKVRTRKPSFTRTARRETWADSIRKMKQLMWETVDSQSMSLLELAEAAEVSYQTLYKVVYSDDVLGFNFDTALAICHVLGIRVALIVGNKDRLLLEPGEPEQEVPSKKPAGRKKKPLKAVSRQR